MYVISITISWSEMVQ